MAATLKKHLASCAWTHMSEMLSCPTSSAPGPWTNNEYVRGADRVNVKDNLPRFSIVLAYDESVLPHWVINDQLIQGTAEIIGVWMCLCVVFPH